MRVLRLTLVGGIAVLALQQAWTIHQPGLRTFVILVIGACATLGFFAASLDNSSRTKPQSRRKENS